MSIYKEPYEKFEKLHPLELRGTEGMAVKLIDFPSNPYLAILTGQKASWRPWQLEFTPEEIRETIDGISKGKIWAGQSLESINFTFAIQNISRACTHQLVRIRIGAGFMQESGREGRWHQAPFITPLTILEDQDIHQKYVDGIVDMYDWYEEVQKHGVPPQDARSMMPHAIAQNMWMTINMRALMEWCSKRLCCNMQWEINTLARMVRDEVILKFPHLGVLLKSHCVREGGHKVKDNTNYYDPGATNNGNKVYWDLEGNMCGQASNIGEDQLNDLLTNEFPV